MTIKTAEEWEEETTKDLRARIIDTLGDEEHVPNTLNNLEAFLRKQLEIVNAEQGQLKLRRKRLP